MSGRDPRDLTQYVILKHWQAGFYGMLIFVSGALAGSSLMAFLVMAR